MLNDKDKSLMDYLLDRSETSEEDRKKELLKKKRKFISLTYDKNLYSSSEIKQELNTDLKLGQLFMHYDVPDCIVEEHDSINKPCEFQAHLMVWSIVREYDKKPTFLQVNKELEKQGVSYPKNYPSRILTGRETMYMSDSTIPNPILQQIEIIIRRIGIVETRMFHKELLGGTQTPLSDPKKWASLTDALYSVIQKKDSYVEKKEIDLQIEETKSVSSESQLRSLASNSPLGNVIEVETKDASSDEFKNLSKELRKRNSEIKQLNSQIKQYQNVIKDYEKELKEVNKEITNKELNVIALKEKLKEDTRTPKESKEVLELKETNKNLAQKNAILILEQNNLRKELEETNDYNDRLNIKLDNLKEKVANKLDYDSIYAILDFSVQEISKKGAKDYNFKILRLIVELMEEVVKEMN